MTQGLVGSSVQSTGPELRAALRDLNAQKAFKSLKAALSSGPVLCHDDPTKPCVIEPDALDYALGAVCSQYDDEGRLHPIAFYSCKLLPAEMNYQIYDKELLAIIAAFKHWRHYLEFSSQPTEVLTDHKNLEYFTTTHTLATAKSDGLTSF